jgi:hypothetical protein
MEISAIKPAALMSYTRFDDEYRHGYLSELGARISREVQLQTGQPFPIFRDTQDIAWGQHWAERISNSLDAVTFLIPILTPGFFKSQWCREELERFLQREAQLGRNDLILPVYFIHIPALEKPDLRERDPLMQTIAARQRIDWRDLRFESFDSPRVRHMLARMAEQIADALDSSMRE